MCVTNQLIRPTMLLRDIVNLRGHIPLLVRHKDQIYVIYCKVINIKENTRDQGVETFTFININDYHMIKVLYAPNLAGFKVFQYSLQTSFIRLKMFGSNRSKKLIDNSHPELSKSYIFLNPYTNDEWLNLHDQQKKKVIVSICFMRSYLPIS